MPGSHYSLSHSNANAKLTSLVSPYQHWDLQVSHILRTVLELG